jgi:hypothetical protein
MSNIYSKIENEIDQYLNQSVEISEGVNYSQNKLVKRISLFKNKIYPKGKTDKQGKYKYWFDIINFRVNNEAKNIQVDTKNPLVFSQNPIGDFSATYIINMSLRDFLWETGRADEMNEATEAFSADGNILFKRTKNGYELCDLTNTYLTNTTAKTVDDTDIIERHQLTQSELRAKIGVWDNVEEVIKECGNKLFSATIKSTKEATSNPYYEIFERNGEVSEAELFEAQNKEGGDENKYILAKIIVAGLEKGSSNGKYVLFAEPLGKKKLSDVYVEAHRGPYKGRWWREGLYELLFDYQVRGNEIGNQLSKGLEWASKTFFRHSDNMAIQNIMTDLANGDAIKSKDLAQVEVKMQGFDQLIADWNRTMAEADKVANSYEVVTGDETKASMPFRLGLLMDTNASKLFLFLRQKLGLAYNKIFKFWIIPELVKNLKGKEIIRVTGDIGALERFRQMAVDNWYVRNLLLIGPHTPEMAKLLKEAKMKEIQKLDPMIENSEKIWKDVINRIWVTMTGENADFNDEMQTIYSMIQLETDPVRRAYLLDRIYAMKGLNVPPPVQSDIPQVAPAAGKPTEEKKGVSEFQTVQTGIK